MPQKNWQNSFIRWVMGFPTKLRLWGIGGVGMSALAQHLHRQGHLVQGYDREPSRQTEILAKLGIPIDFEPSPGRIADVEGIIYTPAIPTDFPEWEAVKQRQLPIWRRAQALAECVASYQVIATAGAHGKTSTSALLAWLLHAVGASPTAFVGGVMRNFGSTYIGGKGPWAVVEADEYDRALLLLRPAHAILQSVDPDHLEIYGSAEALVDTYKTFLAQVEGLCVGPETLPPLNRALLSYRLTHYEPQREKVSFTYQWKGGIRTAVWSQIGRHLAENAAAALTLLEAIGYPFPLLRDALIQFAGVERRMEIHPLGDTHFIVSDYAHHPTEIRRTLESIREAFPNHRVITFFQPHLYSRTAFFAEEFAESLSLSDEVMLFPIYAAREPSTSQVTSKLISQHLRVPVSEPLALGVDMEALSTTIKRHPTVLVFLGAGNIYLLAEAVHVGLNKMRT